MADIFPWLREGIYTFTFLRHPADRVLSNYYYDRYVQGHDYNQDVLQAKKLDLKSLLVEYRTARFSAFANWQTFILAGLRDFEKPPQQILDHAKRTLDSLDFVGLYEELNDSVNSLCKDCGWKVAVTIPKLNITPVRKKVDEIDSEVLALIQEMNSLDIQLYTHAQELYRERTALLQKAPRSPKEMGTKEIVIAHVAVRTSTSESNRIAHGQIALIEISGESLIDCDEVTVGIGVTEEIGYEIYGTNSSLLGKNLSLIKGDKFKIVFSFPVNLAPGIYYVCASVHTGLSHANRCFHWIDNCCSFECYMPENTPQFTGLINLNATLVIST